MPTITAPITECQVCGGPLFDNRGNKKSPKGPDFRCQSESCVDDKGYRTAYWIAPPKAPAKAAPKVPITPTGPVNWAQVGRDYYAAAYCAAHGLAKAMGCELKDLDQAAVQAGAATVLIQLEKQGHRIGTLAPKPKVPKPPTAEELAEMPEPLQTPDETPF